MRQLSAVPWLSSGGRIALSILCVATPGVWRIWPSENQHWREGAEQRIDHGIYPTVFCSVSQNLAILWLLSWLRPLWLNPRKGQREAQRQIRRSFLCLDRGRNVSRRLHGAGLRLDRFRIQPASDQARSEEHTSELQSLRHLVCR